MGIDVICAGEFTMARSPSVEALWGQGRSCASLRYAPSGGLFSLDQSQHVFSRLCCMGKAFANSKNNITCNSMAQQEPSFFTKKNIVYLDKFCKIMFKDFEQDFMKMKANVLWKHFHSTAPELCLDAG